MQQQELRLLAVAFETNDAIIVTDANFRILKVNNAFSTISRFSSDEVDRKSVV